MVVSWPWSLGTALAVRPIKPDGGVLSYIIPAVVDRCPLVLHSLLDYSVPLLRQTSPMGTGQEELEITSRETR